MYKHNNSTVYELKAEVVLQRDSFFIVACIYCESTHTAARPLKVFEHNFWLEYGICGGHC